MRKYLLVYLITFIWLFLSLLNNTYWYNYDEIFEWKTKSIIMKDKIISKTNLSNINNWKKYISNIDNIVSNLSEKKLVSLYNKMLFLEKKLIWKKDIKSINTYKIIIYIKYSSLYKLYEYSIYSENVNKVENINKTVKLDNSNKNIINTNKDKSNNIYENNNQVKSKTIYKDYNIKEKQSEIENVNKVENNYETEYSLMNGGIFQLPHFTNDGLNITFFMWNTTLDDLSNYDVYVNDEKISDGIVEKNWYYELVNDIYFQEGIYSIYIRNDNLKQYSFKYYIYNWEVFSIDNNSITCNFPTTKVLINNLDTNTIYKDTNYTWKIFYDYDFIWKKLNDGNYTINVLCWYLDNNNKTWWYFYSAWYSIKNGNFIMESWWYEYLSSDEKIYAEHYFE